MSYRLRKECMDNLICIYSISVLHILFFNWCRENTCCATTWVLTLSCMKMSTCIKCSLMIVRKTGQCSMVYYNTPVALFLCFFHNNAIQSNSKALKWPHSEQLTQLLIILICLKMFASNLTFFTYRPVTVLREIM